MLLDAEFTEILDQKTAEVSAITYTIASNPMTPLSVETASTPPEALNSATIDVLAISNDGR